MRFAGGFREDDERWWEYSWVFHGVNAGKRSSTLDLESDSGRDLLGRMVADADVVIENFTAGDGELRPELRGAEGIQRTDHRSPDARLRARRPWRDRVGFAMTMEQLAGLAWLTGYPDGLPTARAVPVTRWPVCTPPSSPSRRSNTGAAPAAVSSSRCR